jgi:hypothetical protein
VRSAFCCRVGSFATPSSPRRCAFRHPGDVTLIHFGEFLRLYQPDRIRILWFNLPHLMKMSIGKYKAVAAFISEDMLILINLARSTEEIIFLGL